MNALDRNRYTEAWRSLGASIRRPRAILTTAYTIGFDSSVAVQDAHAAPALPQVPPDETNV